MGVDVRLHVTWRRKVILWLCLCLTLPGAAYAGLAVVYFAWLEEVRQWPAGRAGALSFAALVLSIFCVGLFVYCLVSLIKHAKRPGEKGQCAT